MRQLLSSMTYKSVLLWTTVAIVIAVTTGLMFGPAMPANAEDADRFRDALERIALLDEADGHELTVNQAFRAVAIATSTLGKHPSEILAERDRRKARP